MSKVPNFDVQYETLLSQAFVANSTEESNAAINRLKLIASVNINYVKKWINERLDIRPFIHYLHFICTMYENNKELILYVILLDPETHLKIISGNYTMPSNVIQYVLNDLKLLETYITSDNSKWTFLYNIIDYNPIISVGCS
jgi:hypothetical protein